MTEKEYLKAFDTYRMYIFYFSKKIVDHQEDAEDITTEVFISLWKNKDSIELKSIKAFLLVTANRKCLDLIKARKYNNQKLDAFSIRDLDDIEIDTEVIDYLYKLIESLLPQQRKMMFMKYKEGKEVKDISNILNLSPQTNYLPAVFYFQLHILPLQFRKQFLLFCLCDNWYRQQYHHLYTSWCT